MVDKMVEARVLDLLSQVAGFLRDERDSRMKQRVDVGLVRPVLVLRYASKFKVGARCKRKEKGRDCKEDREDREEIPTVSWSRVVFPPRCVAAGRRVGGVASSFARLLKCFDLCYSTLKEGRSIAKRDLYYCHTSVFRSQRSSDASLDLACSVLGVTRDSLGVYAGSRGLIYGELTASNTAEHRSVCCFPHPALLSLVNPADDLLYRGPLQMILVVEKESVFQAIVQSDFASKHRAIILTSKGYPCVLARQVLKSLAHKFASTPVYCLCDADPHGLDIFLVYQQGSKSLCAQPELAVPRLKWIGLSLSDAKSLGLLNNFESALPFTAHDHAKLRSLMSRTHLQSHPVWQDITVMCEEQVKVELEAIHSLGNSYLTDVFLPMLLVRCSNQSSKQ